MPPLWWLILGVIAGLGVMIPITRALLRRGEARARDAERRARDAERLAELGAMTGGLAHEIKNPLSTVGLNAQLLAEAIDDEDLPPHRKERLIRRIETLRREIDRLRNILTDFLRFAGQMKLDPKIADLRDIADQLCDFFLPQCEQAHVALRCQTPSEPVRAAVDEELFKQALLNLMINAVQAITRDSTELPAGARAGELIVRVEADDDDAMVSVIDTGPGIAPERLTEIFRPYVSGRSGGSGLGLPIARRIAEEHGGTLTVESQPGRGSAFTVRLPKATG